MSSSNPRKGKQMGVERSSKREVASKHRTKRHNATASTSPPGVQKIKALLRQTRRLLSKDNLAADVRVATERRLKSLENDLAKAEQAKLERTMATRYHKVKFFERQKALRKIAQIVKTLESGVNSEGEKLGKKQRKALEKDLFERRVDLNYVLHYPKTSKYISLYPSSKDDEEDGDETQENFETPTTVDESSLKRTEIRERIRQAMESGELSTEPETTIGNRSHQSIFSTSEDMEVSHEQIKRTKKLAKEAETGVAGDDFFEME